MSFSRNSNLSGLLCAVLALGVGLPHPGRGLVVAGPLEERDRPVRLAMPGRRSGCGRRSAGSAGAAGSEGSAGAAGSDGSPAPPAPPLVAAAARREQRAEARRARQRDEASPRELAVLRSILDLLLLGTAPEPPRPPVSCTPSAGAPVGSGLRPSPPRSRSCAPPPSAASRGRRPRSAVPRTSSFRRCTMSRSPVGSSTMYCVIEPT